MILLIKMYLFTANLERAYDRGHQSDVRELRGIQEASRGDQIFTQGVIPKDRRATMELYVGMDVSLKETSSTPS